MKIRYSFNQKLPRGLMFRWALWFMLINSFALMIISMKYYTAVPLPEPLLARTFLGLSYPGHLISLAVYALPIVGLGILFYPKRWFVFTLSIILEVFIILTVLIDTFVFAQYRFHLNGMIWNLLRSGAASDVLPVTGMLWLIFLMVVALLLVCEWVAARIAWSWVVKDRPHYGRLVGVLIVMVILAGHGLHAWADANNHTAITKQVRYLPGYKPLTMKRTLVKLGFAPASTEPSLRLKDSGSSMAYPLEPINCSAATSTKKNLLLIVIESWRFDTLTSEITPNIWNISKAGWSFEKHFSSGNATRFGIFGLFYGLYGTYWHTLLAEEKSPVLMRELEKQTYRMGIFASAPLISPEFDRTVFSDIRAKIELRQEGKNPVERDRMITDKMIRFLDAQPADTPFFGFLFYDSPHAAAQPEHIAPFQPALKEVNHLALNNSTDPVPYFNKYKNSLYYVDMLAGEVLAHLAKKKMLENTIVIITGDHGEEFNDLKMNYWGHVGNFSRFQTQTPLVVLWPGESPSAFTHVTSHLDIAPTLMNRMLGCTTEPSKYSNGRNLVDLSPRPYVLISSWDTFSTIETDRITVAKKSGEIDILDQSYRELRGAKVRPEISKSAMEGMGRFYGR
ncbi:MAG: hypothetical protein A2X80_12625 [Geobacteraceae bacterium GWB2_52_12]|nr:MAG: hypothetical protein A2X80_12625 [Geobacteraceae bacterium GWB2_52_12]